MRQYQHLLTHHLLNEYSIVSSDQREDPWLFCMKVKLKIINICKNTLIFNETGRTFLILCHTMLTVFVPRI